jgi:hypothetical protein
MRTTSYRSLSLPTNAPEVSHLTVLQGDEQLPAAVLLRVANRKHIPPDLRISLTTLLRTLDFSFQIKVRFLQVMFPSAFSSIVEVSCHCLTALDVSAYMAIFTCVGCFYFRIPEAICFAGFCIFFLHVIIQFHSLHACFGLHGHLHERRMFLFSYSWRNMLPWFLLFFLHVII